MVGLFEGHETMTDDYHRFFLVEIKTKNFHRYILRNREILVFMKKSRTVSLFCWQFQHRIILVIIFVYYVTYNYRCCCYLDSFHISLYNHYFILVFRRQTNGKFP